MTRPLRIARNVVLTLAGVLVLAALATLLVVRTDWFRNYIREKIVTSTEESTGGKVEISAFSFDVRHLSAVVTGFVIHGKEPAGADPLVRAEKVQLDIRLFTGLTHWLNLHYLGIDRVKSNVIVFADGTTNIPEPRKKSESKTGVLESIVDLAVDDFQITNGSAVYDGRPQALNLNARNLRAQLFYNILQKGYEGRLELEPLFLTAAQNPPVRFRLNLPVVITKNRIDVRDGEMRTAVSSVKVNGSVETLKEVKVTAHLNGTVAMIDLANAANLPLDVNAKGVPDRIELDANAVMAGDTISVTGLRAIAGQSNIVASGLLRDAKGNAGLQFKAQLALRELSRLAKIAGSPSGVANINGIAKLDATNNYNVAGEVAARGVSYQQGSQTFRDVSLMSAFELDPKNLNLRGLRLHALGGDFAGNVLLADFRKYTVQGKVSGFDLQTVAKAFGQQLPYSGVATGTIDASGDARIAGTKGIAGSARLSIVAGKRGLPLSGKLNARYDGASDNIIVENSYLTLPHSRLTLNGALGRQLNIALTSKDISELLAAAYLKDPPKIVLIQGQADFTGTITGALSTPKIQGHLAVTRFSVEGRQFDSLAADVLASQAQASVANGSIARGPMLARFDGNVGLRNWSVIPTAPVSANLTLVNGDLADALALAGQPSEGYSGALTANAKISGTVGNPVGAVNAQALNGRVADQAYDRMEARIDLRDQLVTVPSAFVQSPAGRVDGTAEFRHPRDSFSTGTVHAHVKTAALDIGKVRANAGGTVQLDADVNGNLATSGFLLTMVNADASARNLQFEGQPYNDATATARTNGQTVTYNLTSNFAGSNVKAAGTTQLVKDYPTKAEANVSGLPIEKVLLAAKRADISAKGILAGALRFDGTLQNPQGSADVDIARAVIYDEPLDRVRLRATYLNNSIDVPELRVTAGSSEIQAAGRYDHPAGNLLQGSARFNVTSSHIDLAKVRNVQKLRPGLGGTLDISGNGEATVIEKEPRVLFRVLNANVSASRLAAQGKNFGDLKLVANTTGGNHLNFTVTSNITGADIQGGGTAELAGDYPVNAKLAFNNVSWTKVQSFLGGVNAPPAFEAAADGEITVAGPALKTDQLNGSAKLSKLTFTTIPRSPAAKQVTIANREPIALSLDRGTVRVQSAHLTGPNTDIQITGTAVLATQALNLNVNATADLEVLQNFDRDLYARGGVTVATTVRGTVQDPLLNGQIALKNASLNYASLPTGLANANGVILLSGDSARVQSLTAEAGGGRLTVTGFAGFSGPIRLGLRAQADNVRIRVQQGVSVHADADIRLTGNAQSSVLAGTATIQQIAYAPQSDIGSLLTRAAPPVQSPAVPSPLLENMKLDLRVRTAPGLAVQASLAENLQANADLRVRGTVTQPGVLGRVTLNEGQLVFFGAEYKLNTGSISFYNPTRIEPILDISLETQAKGVDVVLRVTGPVDNMKLSYTSDPPLQFQEIITLLASGRAPTSDPTLLASQPQQPAQGFQQMGESALLGKAVTDPVASRLQRVFGVTQLKIDPSFTTGSDVPTARLTLQQRITSNLTFTYVSAINDPNGTIVRIEFAFNPQVSAVATRDQNGIFSVNLFYKKQFR